MIGPHTAIPVRNTEESVTFYEKLGFVIDEKWERPDWQMIGQMLVHPSGFAIELIAHQKNTNIDFPEHPEVLHIAIPVKDLPKQLEMLKRVGATIVRPTTQGIKVQRLAFIKDPNGFVIELFEPKE